MGGYNRENRRKAINHIINLYKNKQPIDINTIYNEQILLTCACRYNDIKTVDAIINSNIGVYYTKPLKVAFKYGNFELCSRLLEYGASITTSPFRYRKNWGYLIDMVDNGLQECNMNLMGWPFTRKIFRIDDFKLLYIYYKLCKVYIPDLAKIICDYL
jgi:hypothetical protein